VKQHGKWDFTRIPFEPGIVGAIPCGDYFRSRVLAYLPEGYVETNRPLLRTGDRGMFVKELQGILHDEGFFSGKIDGKFGPRTEAQVRAFQAHNGLHADGIVGSDTWTALMNPKPMEAREVTEQDLRESGSNTIAIADQAEKRTKQAAMGAVGLGTLDTAMDAADKLTGAEGTLQALQGVVADNWPILILIAGGLVAFKYGPNLMQRLRVFRTLDAKSGANLKR